VRDRDEQVFSELIERWSGRHLALTHVESRAIATDSHRTEGSLNLIERLRGPLYTR